MQSAFLNWDKSVLNTLDKLVILKLTDKSFSSELTLQVPRVPMHALAMVVPPQEPDRTPQETPPALLSLPKG